MSAAGQFSFYSPLNEFIPAKLFKIDIFAEVFMNSPYRCLNIEKRFLYLIIHRSKSWFSL